MLAPAEIKQDASEGVREDTAELASWVLSDVASIRSSHSSVRHNINSVSNQRTPQNEPYVAGRMEQDDLSRNESNDSSRPGVIEEVSEPASPDSLESSRMSHEISALTEMVRASPPTQEGNTEARKNDTRGKSGLQPVTVQEGIISQPDEQTALLLRKVAYGSDKSYKYGSMGDLESQGVSAKGQMSQIRKRVRYSTEHIAHLIKRIASPKSWDQEAIFEHGLRRPASYIPPVILGLLLNVLDALSYGKHNV